jgi:hypothetical protein
MAALPNPLPPETDWKFLIEWVSAWIAGASTLIYLIRSYFRDKREQADRDATLRKTETNEFIEKVAVACVRATLNGVLDEVNKKVDQLFIFREADLQSNNSQFKELMRELRK